MDARPGRRIDRFFLFRLAAIPLAFALVVLCRRGLAPGFGDRAFVALSAILAAYTVLALAPLAAPARLRTARWFMISQVGVDFAIVAALIWLTGGLESVFCPLLFTTLFNASTVLRGPETIAFAAGSTAFLAAASIGYRLGIPPAPSWMGRPGGLEPAEAAAHLMALGMALHAVGLLGTRLARGLRRIQGLQEEILENMAEGLIAVDGDGRVLEVNGEARRIFGIGREMPCAGRSLPEAFPGEPLRPLREAFGEGDERRRTEFLHVQPNGRPVPVEAKISSISDGRGRPRCRIGLFGDLSLKKEIEEAERKIHRLEELYDMAMSIAHEIRNPLASIRGCVQEIGRSRERSPTEARLVDIVCRESDRLDRIIEDFMTNARRGPVSLRPLDLVAILEDTVLQLRNHPQVAGRRIILEPAPGPFHLSGDPQRLKQVFLNLGFNAIEATDPAGGTIRISLRPREFLAMNRRRAGERRMVPGVEVEFSDDGAGMSSEVKNLVFTPFFTTKERGHGLGLAIVHRIVRDHLGKVDVESEPGKGCRFRVWLPLLVREPAFDREPEASAPEEMVHA
jgi:two-component system sensor histidine kinase PilS (NtrC family)